MTTRDQFDRCTAFREAMAAQRVAWRSGPPAPPPTRRQRIARWPESDAAGLIVPALVWLIHVGGCVLFLWWFTTR